MRKIEIISLRDGIQFENEINEFIAREYIEHVYDIKYNVNMDDNGNYYHAMIYYETKD